MANNKEKNRGKDAVKAKRPSDKRNLKYGSLSVIVTVIFAALIIVLNIIVTSLSSVYGWYTDMTAAGIYSLSDTFSEKMGELLSKTTDGKPVYLNIVLMAEEDYFKGMNSLTAMVYRTLKELVAEFDNIELVAYNTTVHPELAEKYKRTALDTPALSDVVLELCDENHNALENVPAKKYAIESFFTADSSSGSYIGYNAEARLLSAVAQLTGQTEKPVAYYLQGHGEPTLAEASDWQEVLELAGFEVKEINLSNEDFPVEGASNDSIVIINCPKYDLLSTTEVSEVKKIRTFLGTNYGNMIVVEDASVLKLPALEGLLSEWGLGFGGSVTDDKHSVSSSGAAKVIADYAQTYKPSESSPSMATQILNKMFGTTSNLPTTIFSTPKEIVILDDSEIPKGMNGSASSFALLQTYDTARTRGASDGETSTGSVPLLGVSRMVWELNANEVSYVVALGSADFLSSEYEGSCANRSIMYALLNLMWDSVTTFEGIDYKEFDSSALTVSTSAASAWTIVCVVVLPVLVAGLGVYVYIRRRHS